jgi:predicted flavoprotein YhiN
MDLSEGIHLKYIDAMSHRGSVIVVGGGASGMMAAGRAAEKGASVTLLQKTGRLGQKILLSGKKRCNLTNAKDIDHFISMYGPNGRFLHRAFRRFFREDLVAFLHRYGVETKTERGGRVFPASDRASDVVDALERYLSDQGVEILRHIQVTGVETHDNRVTGVATVKGERQAGAVILSAGGATYPATGSTGDGYVMAAALGHSIIKLRPALVPLVVEEIPLARSMQGVSLRNVRLTAFRSRAQDIESSLSPESDTGRGTGSRKPRPPVIESRSGEMMITHFGIGGPATLLMSLAIVDALEHGPVSVSIDLKPALDRNQLRRRLQRDFDRHSGKKFRSIMKGLVPLKMVDPFVSMTNIPPDKAGCQINSAERERLLDHLKSLRFNIKQPLPMSSAIVTAGGVSLKEIDPLTMGSRKVNGLYLCGEVMDIDADTGGYNLQAAFSTGYLAGEQAADYVNLKEPSINRHVDL